MQEKNDEMPQTKLDPFFELMVFNPASRLSSLNSAIRRFAIPPHSE